LPAHCVSHCVFEKSEDFLNNYRNFQPHCVSHRVEDQSAGQSRPVARLAVCIVENPLPHPVPPLSWRLAPSPIPARTPMTLALTWRGATDPLPLTGAWMRLKPSPADSARSLAAHLALRETNRRASTYRQSPSISRAQLLRVGRFSLAGAGQF